MVYKQCPALPPPPQSTMIENLVWNFELDAAPGKSPTAVGHCKTSYGTGSSYFLSAEFWRGWGAVGRWGGGLCSKTSRRLHLLRWLAYLSWHKHPGDIELIQGRGVTEKPPTEPNRLPQLIGGREDVTIAVCSGNKRNWVKRHKKNRVKMDFNVQYWYTY